MSREILTLEPFMYVELPPVIVPFKFVPTNPSEYTPAVGVNSTPFWSTTFETDPDVTVTVKYARATVGSP